MIVHKLWKNRIGLVSESLTKGLLVMVILERIKGEPSGNKVFKDFVYRDCLKPNGLLKHKRWMSCMFLVSDCNLPSWGYFQTKWRLFTPESLESVNIKFIKKHNDQSKAKIEYQVWVFISCPFFPLSRQIFTRNPFPALNLSFESIINLK